MIINSPLLPSLLLFDDPEPHPGTWNMAVDEVLLQTARVPILRFYRWAQPTVSFGCFQPWAEVAHRFSDWELVRRPTGGGAVEHLEGAEATYALIVPRAGGTLASLGERPADVFHRVHTALGTVLNALGITVEMHMSDGVAGLGGACFHDQPVPGDLVEAADGRKVAGAAQRRTREGLLHQGSIQLPDWFDAPWLPHAFAEVLAPKPSEISDLSREVLESSEQLRRTKYAQRAWTERR